MPGKSKKVKRAAKKGVGLLKRLIPGVTTRKAVNYVATMAGANRRQAKMASSLAAGALNLYGSRKRKARSSRPVNVAVDTTITNTTWSEVVGKAVSKYAGREVAGVKIRGSQPFVLMQIPASTGFTGATMVDDVAVVSTDPTSFARFVHLCPQVLGGPLYVQAAVYEQFAFRKVTLRYNTRVSTTTAGLYALAYIRDPETETLGSETVPTNFGEMREITPSVTFPVRSEGAQLQFTYDGDQLWFCDPTASTRSDVRLCMQGQIRAAADAIGTLSTPVSTGYITIDYELDLFSPTPPARNAELYRNLTLPREDRLKVYAYAQELRKARERKEGIVRVEPAPPPVAEPDYTFPEEDLEEQIAKLEKLRLMRSKIPELGRK